MPSYLVLCSSFFQGYPEALVTLLVLGGVVSWIFVPQGLDTSQGRLAKFFLWFLWFLHPWSGLWNFLAGSLWALGSGGVFFTSLCSFLSGQGGS